MNLKRYGLCGIAIILSILGIAGIVVALLASNIFGMIIRNYVLLGPNSMSKEMWTTTPRMQTSVYLFEVENPDEVMNGGSPKLMEKGPFVYDEYHHKKNVQWNSNGTVTYETAREYHFNPDETKGTLDDVVTIVNPPAGTISYIAKYLMTEARRKEIDLAVAFLGEEVFVNKSAREIIFDGYHDPIMSLGPTGMDKFAIFYKRNMSSLYDGVFNLFTGHLNKEEANQMHSWNFDEKIPYFPDKCGKVFGNGEMFKPALPQSKVAMFSNDLCRPIIFKFEDLSSVKGVWGNKYVLDDKFLSNSTENEDNWCFEAPTSWDNPKPIDRLQFPSGVFNLGLCKFNSSTFISQPHFFGADPFYLNQFTKGSLNPNEKQHQTSIVIDPLSGIPLEVAARFQVNILIEPSKEIGLFEQFKKPIFIPAFWFETKMVLPDNLKIQMWIVTNLQTIFRITGYTVFGLAIGFVGILFFVFRNRSRNAGIERLVEVEEDTHSSSDEEEESTPDSLVLPEEDATSEREPILNE